MKNLDSPDETQVKDGCRWVRMGSYGFGGVRGMGGEVNQANRGAYGRAGHAFYAIAGEISPKICADRHIE